MSVKCDSEKDLNNTEMLEIEFMKIKQRIIIIYPIENQCIPRHQTSLAYVVFVQLELPIVIALAPKRKISQHLDGREMIIEHLPYNIWV